MYRVEKMIVCILSRGGEGKKMRRVGGKKEVRKRRGEEQEEVNGVDYNIKENCECNQMKTGFYFGDNFEIVEK